MTFQHLELITKQADYNNLPYKTEDNGGQDYQITFYPDDKFGRKTQPFTNVTLALGYLKRIYNGN